MERQYYTRESTDLEKETFAYVCRDEKNIPLGTFEPCEMLQYRGYTIPIYMDEPGQQYFIVFKDDEWGNPMGDYDDFMDFIDSKLDMFVPNKTLNQISTEMNSLTHTLLKLLRLPMDNTDMKKYQESKELETNINKYLGILQIMSHLIEVVPNTGSTTGNKYRVKLRQDILVDDMLLDQVKRVIENINKCK